VQKNKKGMLFIYVIELIFVKRCFARFGAIFGLEILKPLT